MLGSGDADRSSQTLPLLLLATSFLLTPPAAAQTLPPPQPCFQFLHPGVLGSRQTLKRLPLKQIIQMGKPHANIADLTRPTLLSEVDAQSFSPASCVFLISQGSWGSKPSQTPPFHPRSSRSVIFISWVAAPLIYGTRTLPECRFSHVAGEGANWYNP